MTNIACDEIRLDAAGYAALPGEDPERRAAYAHATGCARCAAALAEGERLMVLLEAVPLEAPSEAAIRAAARAIQGERPAVAARPWLAGGWLALGSLGAFALLLLLGSGATRLPRAMAAAGALSAAAGLLALFSARRGGAVVAAAAGVSALFTALAVRSGGLDAATGVHCLAVELGAAALPLGVAAILVLRGHAPSLGAAGMAAAAAAGALTGQAALHLMCPAHGASHLALFHTGGVLVAALAGAVLSRLPPLRARA